MDTGVQQYNTTLWTEEHRDYLAKAWLAGRPVE
jgi:hypothetical protein